MDISDPDCSICLQTLSYPVKLPCGHLFCFLCIKGSAFHDRRCPMCRQRFSIRLLDNPQILNVPENLASPVQSSQFAWFYEGRNGWWQYDRRTSSEIETAFSQNLPNCEVTVAGYLYEINFTSMHQARKNGTGRSRRIKRDRVDCDKKGIAGLRLSLIGASSSALDDVTDPIAPTTPINNQTLQQQNSSSS